MQQLSLMGIRQKRTRKQRKIRVRKIYHRLVISQMLIMDLVLFSLDTAVIRKQYFNCTDLKTLFNNVAGDTILAYLSEINLIRKI